MKKGRLGKGVRLTVPLIYIDPKILNKDGYEDMEVKKALYDIWSNYNVNIRYLNVITDSQAYYDPQGNLSPVNVMGLPFSFNQECTLESKLLSHIQPETVVCFFGRKEVLPSNYKVYSRDEFVNNYSIILSNLNTKDKVMSDVKQRFRRRRGE